MRSRGVEEEEVGEEEKMTMMMRMMRRGGQRGVPFIKFFFRAKRKRQTDRTSIAAKYLSLSLFATA